ncbi:MAG: hypothetical protein IPK24_24265 [Kineosporiaceae bacterium]|nr:hypothetical protein [Kineosporiaceae bacterium]
MGQPRIRITDLTDALPELADDQLDLIVGGMVDDNTSPPVSLFDWDVTSVGFGLDGGGSPDGGTLMGGSLPMCEVNPRTEPFRVYQGDYWNTPIPTCSLSLAATTTPDSGVGRDFFAN